MQRASRRTHPRHGLTCCGQTGCINYLPTGHSTTALLLPLGTHYSNRQQAFPPLSVPQVTSNSLISHPTAPCHLSAPLLPPPHPIRPAWPPLVNLRAHGPLLGSDSSAPTCTAAASSPLPTLPSSVSTGSRSRLAVPLPYMSLFCIRGQVPALQDRRAGQTRVPE